MASETFELRRFGWATPDRLEIEGRFVGRAHEPVDNPVLVLRGTDQMHRLPVVRGEVADETTDDGEWRAVFAWLETPAAFDVAHLELGDGLIVELPVPQLDDDEPDPEMLDVRRRGGEDRLHERSRLLALESQLLEATERLARSDEELARVRADLTAERAARADDAQRFRAGLAEIQEAADEAVAETRAEADGLRVRVEELAAAGKEAKLLRKRLTSIRDLVEEGIPSARPDAGGDAGSP